MHLRRSRSATSSQGFSILSREALKDSTVGPPPHNGPIAVTAVASPSSEPGGPKSNVVDEAASSQIGNMQVADGAAEATSAEVGIVLRAAVRIGQRRLK